MEDLRELPPGTVAIMTVVGEDKFRAILRTPDVQKALRVSHYGGGPEPQGIGVPASAIGS